MDPRSSHPPTELIVLKSMKIDNMLIKNQVKNDLYSSRLDQFQFVCL